MNFITKIGGTGTLLNASEMEHNIKAIHTELKKYGWTDEAIAGACGCFYAESGFNPGIYETSHNGNLKHLPFFPGGMGIAQWTDYPAYTSKYPNPLAYHAYKENRDWYDGEFQCWLLNQCDNMSYTDMNYGQGPRWGWQTSNKYPSISFSKYKNSKEDPVTLCKYFFFCFEWHYHIVPSGYLETRYKWAKKSYQIIKNINDTPATPTKSSTPAKHYIIIGR